MEYTLIYNKSGLQEAGDIMNEKEKSLEEHTDETIAKLESLEEELKSLKNSLDDEDDDFYDESDNLDNEENDSYLKMQEEAELENEGADDSKSNIKPFSQMTREELREYINKHSDSVMDDINSTILENLTRDEMLKYVTEENTNLAKKDNNDEESSDDYDKEDNLNQDQVELKNEDSNSPTIDSLNDNKDYESLYEVIKSEIPKGKIKPNKMDFKLLEDFDYEKNEEELIKLEDQDTYIIKYESTGLDEWLLKNYTSYKYVGSAKKIKEEYKLALKNGATKEGLYNLKVKFQEAFVPSLFYTSENGIYAKKYKDYLFKEYEGEKVPYQYLLDNGIEYDFENLIYEDAVNQIKTLDSKQNDNDEIKELYYNDYCYINSKEMLKSSEKLKRAYKKISITSLVFGIVFIIFGILTLIPPVADAIENVLDVNNIAPALFVGGLIMCFILILYLLFSIPMKKRIKRLSKIRGRFLTFMHNDTTISKTKSSIANSKVNKLSTSKINSSVRQLAANDYGVVLSITKNQIAKAKDARADYKNNSRIVRWICRIYSVITTSLISGSVALILNVLLARMNVINDANVSIGLVYLMSFVINVVLSCLFLITKKKPNLNRGLYYLYVFLSVVLVSLLQIFVLYQI